MLGKASYSTSLGEGNYCTEYFRNISFHLDSDTAKTQSRLERDCLQKPPEIGQEAVV